MARRIAKNPLSNQKGIAIIEALPLLVVFLVLISYGLGLWGVVHTGVLHSIGARASSFRVFNNRANLNYFSDTSTSIFSYERSEVRFSGVLPDRGPNNFFYATLRPIAIGREVATTDADFNDHNTRIYEIGERNREGGVEVNPVWITIGYGMCLNASCGGN